MLESSRNSFARSRWWLALLVVPMLSCGDPTAPSEPPIRDVLWRATSIRTSSATVVVPNPERYTLRFSDSLGIRADCNSCGGSYTLSGNRVAISGVFCTLIFCGDDSLDRDYLRLLNAAVTAEVVDGELVLTSPEGVLRFRQ